LRQVTTLVGELRPAVDELRRAFGLSVSRWDDGTTAAANGIDNAWLPVGSSILEVITPVRPGDATHRFHERFGAGGYMVILQVDDLDAARASLAGHDVRVTWEIDQGDSKELHLDHRDVGGTFVAVDWADPPGLWRWAGPDWPSHVRTDVITEILAAEIHTPEPGAVAARWGQLLDRQPVAGEGGAFELVLDRGRLRFLPSDQHGRGRVTGVDVGAAPGQEVGRELDVAGLRFRFVPSQPPAEWWA
jgi:hypothetical protein